jgi:hypothetical protein
VFKRRLPNGAKKKRKFGAFGAGGGEGGGGRDGKDEEEVNTDPFGRPREKVTSVPGLAHRWLHSGEDDTDLTRCC